MDFSKTEEQQLLSESIGKYIANDYSFERRRKLIAAGGTDEVWQQFAELGWLCVPFAEEYGGMAGGLCDLAVVMEEFGKGLVVEPYLASVVLGGFLLGRLGEEERCKQLIPALVEGRLKLALACYEPDSRFRLDDVQTTARSDATGWSLNGKKAVVLHGGQADKLLVVARSAGSRYDAEGLSLFLVDRDTPGLAIHDYPTVDGQRAAELTLTDMRLPDDALVGPEGTALQALQDATDRAAIVLCAEAVGIMDLLLARTIEYTRTRQQFGQPIARFQALQHRMADMFIECQQARSILLMATMHADANAAPLAQLASAAKARIGRAARKVGQEAVQLHGGIAVTDDFDIGHYFKRLTTIAQSFGSTDHHLSRYAQQAVIAAGS